MYLTRFLRNNSIKFFNNKLKSSDKNTFLAILKEMEDAHIESDKETLEIIDKIMNSNKTHCGTEPIPKKTKISEDRMREYLKNKKYI
jgi:hypothetical protein